MRSPPGQRARLHRPSSIPPRLRPSHRRLVRGRNRCRCESRRQAEVGIAVSGATEVAKGSASAVLTREGLAPIVDLVKNRGAIYQRVVTWIVNEISRSATAATPLLP